MPRSQRTAPELFIATLIVTAVLGTLDAAAAPLEVTVGDVRSTEGVLLIQITDSAEGFDDGRPPVASFMLAPAVSGVTFSVDLEPGAGSPPRALGFKGELLAFPLGRLGSPDATTAHAATAALERARTAATRRSLRPHEARSPPPAKSCCGFCPGIWRTFAPLVTQRRL